MVLLNIGNDVNSLFHSMWENDDVSSAMTGTEETHARMSEDNMMSNLRIDYLILNSNNFCLPNIHDICSSL